jgi:hypothetical protein
LARQTTAPVEAEERADWAAETLETVEVQPAGGVVGSSSTGGGGAIGVIVQLLVAGEVSVFPAASVARTENW